MKPNATPAAAPLLRRIAPVLLALSLAAFSQQVSDGAGVGNATRLQGVAVAATAPAANQVLTFNGSAWTPAAGAGSANPIIAAQTAVTAGDTVGNGCSGAGCDFADGTFTFPAGSFCPSVGTVYRLHSAGLYTTSAAGNIGEGLYLSGTLVAAAQVYENSGLSSLPWSGDAWITCVAAGSNGAVEVSWTGNIEAASSGNNSAAVVKNPANAATIPINTTAAVTVESRAYFGASTAGSVTERQFILLAF